MQHLALNGSAPMPCSIQAVIIVLPPAAAILVQTHPACPPQLQCCCMLVGLLRIAGRQSFFAGRQACAARQAHRSHCVRGPPGAACTPLAGGARCAAQPHINASAGHQGMAGAAQPPSVVLGRKLSVSWVNALVRVRVSLTLTQLGERKGVGKWLVSIWNWAVGLCVSIQSLPWACFRGAIPLCSSLECHAAHPLPIPQIQLLT